MNEKFSHRGFDRIIRLTPEMKDRVSEVYTHVNGRLLKIGRLIERTFGKGSFRKLAEDTHKER